MTRGAYRPDIEGLRAVAVLAVVFFHAGLWPFAGGFLGVDVFFVISGFLITGLLARDLEDGTFSLLRFYQRRVARILPALLAMELVLLVAAMLFFLPSEMASLRAAATSAPLFLSNIYFWHRDAYFAPIAEAQPLLHTWSLGVEEQFYLLYPLLLLAASRWRARGRIWLVLSASLASLAAAVFLAARDPEAAFYLLPARFWELGLGGLMAIGRWPRLERRFVRELLCAAAGLGLLLAFPLVRPGIGTPFPAALLPCAATAFLLRFGEGSGAGRLLSMRPMQALGRVSYSLYLWHVPVLVLWRVEFGFTLSATERTGLIAASVVLAFLSYALVEAPLRHRLRRARPLIVIAGGATAAAAVAIFAFASTTEQWRFRPLPPAAARLNAIRFEKHEWHDDPRYPGCRASAASRSVTCLSVRPGMRNILLVGDSHAAHIRDALLARFPDIRFSVSIQIGCRPLVRGHEKRRGCRARVVQALRWAVHVRVAGVILAARWEREELSALRDTIMALRRHGIRVVVIGPVVEYVPSEPELLARAVINHDRTIVDRGRLLERAQLDREMEPLVRAAGGAYFSAYRAECRPGRPCLLLTRNGRPFHFDYGHYTADGARQIIASMPRP